MHIVAIAWVFVIGLLALAEATSPQGSVFGALVTLVFYGVLPLTVVLYVLGTSARRRARARGKSSEQGCADPHRGHHAPGDAVAPERKEP